MRRGGLFRTTSPNIHSSENKETEKCEELKVKMFPLLLSVVFWKIDDVAKTMTYSHL